MTLTNKEPASDREILLVGPYGVLGTGVIDAVAADPAWRVTTAARRPAPAYRAQTPPRGVCHTDIHTAHGEWDGLIYPNGTIYSCVPGHEIVGRVTSRRNPLASACVWRCTSVAPSVSPSA
jgi:hypothetical protein